MENLKVTPLFDEYKKFGGKIIDFAGWALPVQFDGILEEHNAVRTTAGLFDVSHMGEVTFKGKDAQKLINHLVTNDISNLTDGHITYSPMCYENGGCVDDLLIYKFADDFYYLVINAGNSDKDYEWFLKNKDGFDVNIENISSDVSQLALQGPNAEKILQTLTDTDLSQIKFYNFKRDVKVGDLNCLVSRTGYTGEDGFEVYTNSKNAVFLYERIYDAGKDSGLKLAGLGCRDTLRFEASLPLYGNELTKDITPLEAGLGIFVKLDKDEFIGKEALKSQKETGLLRKIVGFEMLGKGIARHGYEVLSDGKKIGEVTTGYFSPTLKKNIGLALVDINYSKLGTCFNVKIRNKEVKAQVVNRHFYKKNYKK